MTKEKNQKQEEKKEEKQEEKKEEEKKEEEKKEEKKDDKKEEKKDDKKDEKKEEKKDDQEEVAVPKKFKAIVEEIENMSVIDLSELVKILEKKFGVSAQPVAAAPAQGGGSGEEKQEEKSVYDVELTETGSNKISVIKGIREFVSIGLKEAKEMADNAPKVIKNQVPKEDADKMKKKLEEAGAKVTLK